MRRYAIFTIIDEETTEKPSLRAPKGRSNPFFEIASVLLRLCLAVPRNDAENRLFQQSHEKGHFSTLYGKGMAICMDLILAFKSVFKKLMKKDQKDSTTAASNFQNFSNPDFACKRVSKENGFMKKIFLKISNFKTKISQKNFAENIFHKKIAQKVFTQISKQNIFAKNMFLKISNFKTKISQKNFAENIFHRKNAQKGLAETLKENIFTKKIFLKNSNFKTKSFSKSFIENIFQNLFSKNGDNAIAAKRGTDPERLLSAEGSVPLLHNKSYGLNQSRRGHLNVPYGGFVGCHWGEPRHNIHPRHGHTGDGSGGRMEAVENAPAPAWKKQAIPSHSRAGFPAVASLWRDPAQRGNLPYYGYHYGGQRPIIQLDLPPPALAIKNVELAH